MKKKIAFALATAFVLTFVLAIPAIAADSFLWDDFSGRDPNNKPELAPNGVNMWWDNWANLRASVENDVVQINYKPKAFDSEDFDDMADYYARAADWMGNWGEAVNMWALEGIQYCKYLTIRMKGEEGGEENKLILHFQPEDGPIFVKRFSELTVKGGGNAKITKDMQDVVIDLQASGFPGMTNRMHIRAFAECTIFLDKLTFSDPVGPINTESVDTILGGFTVGPTVGIGELPIETWVNEVSKKSGGLDTMMIIWIAAGVVVAAVVIVVVMKMGKKKK